MGQGGSLYESTVVIGLSDGGWVGFYSKPTIPGFILYRTIRPKGPSVIWRVG